jgi:hypothetical protein
MEKIMISEAPGYCANCGGQIRLSIRPTIVPSRVPMFCSEQCARAYLVADEASLLR